jgi:hypothetical protein
LSAQNTTVKLPGEVNSEVVKHPTGMVCTIGTPADTVQHVLNAYIVDSTTGDTLPFAVVTIKGTRLGAQADVNGKVVLEIPDSLAQDTITLVVKLIGYEPLEYSVAANRISATEKLYIRPAEMILKGDVKVIKMGKPRIQSTEDK